MRNIFGLRADQLKPYEVDFLAFVQLTLSPEDYANVTSIRVGKKTAVVCVGKNDIIEFDVAADGDWQESE